MRFPAAAGVNVAQVRDVLTDMAQGRASFQDVAAAVDNAEFASGPVARSLVDVFDNWDYPGGDDTFNDVVSAALFRGILSREQVAELRQRAKFRPPDPSRQVPDMRQSG